MITDCFDEILGLSREIGVERSDGCAYICFTHEDVAFEDG
jgi:hypothetical protein